MSKPLVVCPHCERRFLASTKGTGKRCECGSRTATLIRNGRRVRSLAVYWGPVTAEDEAFIIEHKTKR